MVACLVNAALTLERCKFDCKDSHPHPQCAYSNKIRGNNYKTFSNRCELDKYVCIHRTLGKSNKNKKGNS